MGEIIDGFEIAGPTEHEMAVAEACREKVAAAEADMARIASSVETSERDTAAYRSLLVDLEIAQSALEFWRAKLARVCGRNRHEGRDGYWLVPRQPSRRALRLANGLTDLADIACSPRDLESTMREIAVAVRIVIEEDGIPFAVDAPVSLARDEIDLDERLVAAKETLCKLSDTEAELVRTSARYMLMRDDLKVVAESNSDIAEIVRKDASRGSVCGTPGESGSFADAKSLEVWGQMLSRQA